MCFEMVAQAVEDLSGGFEIVARFVERGKPSALAIMIGENAVDDIHSRMPLFRIFGFESGNAGSSGGFRECAP